ncbi:hypothetical protein QG37_03776 [Candidozyma auris]|nr:hypothetical protein QG37_03776 [[Candida] auris]
MRLTLRLKSPITVGADVERAIWRDSKASNTFSMVLIHFVVPFSFSDFIQRLQGRVQSRQTSISNMPSVLSQKISEKKKKKFRIRWNLRAAG